MEHVLFSHILGIIIPIDSYFSEGLKPPTSYEWFSSFHHCFSGGGVPNLPVNGAPVRAPQDTARLPSGDTSNSAQAALEDAGLGSMT